jgi:hypothetical protein
VGESAPVKDMPRMMVTLTLETCLARVMQKQGIPALDLTCTATRKQQLVRPTDAAALSNNRDTRWGPQQEGTRLLPMPLTPTTPPPTRVKAVKGVHSHISRVANANSRV